jgi:hypothetical protein
MRMEFILTRSDPYCDVVDFFITFQSTTKRVFGLSRETIE